MPGMKGQEGAESSRLSSQYRFRERPYIRCNECLASDRLKCQNCMVKMLNQLSHRNSEKKEKMIAQFKAIEIKNTMIRKSLQDQNYKKNSLVLSNKYDQWIQHTARKKQPYATKSSRLFTPKKRSKLRLSPRTSYNQPLLQPWESHFLEKLIKNRI